MFQYPPLPFCLSTGETARWKSSPDILQHPVILLLRLTIFCGLLLTSRDWNTGISWESLLWFFQRKSFEALTLQRKIWKMWCKFATEIQKENTKNNKRHFIFWRGCLMCFGKCNLQYCVGSSLPYFTLCKHLYQKKNYKPLLLLFCIMLCSLVQASYTKDRAMVLLCFLELLGQAYWWS